MRKRMHTPETLLEKYFRSFMEGENSLIGPFLLVPVGIMGYFLGEAYLYYHDSPVITFFMVLYMLSVSYWAVPTVLNRYGFKMKKRYMALMILGLTSLIFLILWLVATMIMPYV